MLRKEVESFFAALIAIYKKIKLLQSGKDAVKTYSTKASIFNRGFYFQFNSFYFKFHYIQIQLKQ